MRKEVSRYGKGAVYCGYTHLFFYQLVWKSRSESKGICSRVSKQSDVLMVPPILRILCNLWRDEDEMVPGGHHLFRALGLVGEGLVFRGPIRIVMECTLREFILP